MNPSRSESATSSPEGGKIRTRRSWGWTFRSSVIALWACGPIVTSSTATAEDASNFRSVTQPILGGEKSELTPVVYVSAHQEGYRPSQCSGSVVAPNMVLTALHCISDYVDGTYTCSTEGAIDDSFPRDPTEAGRLGAPFAPESVRIFTSDPVDTTEADAVGIAVVSPRADSICRNDLAFVVLDRDLDVGVLPLRIGKGMIPGETVTVAGFGINEERINTRMEKTGLRLQGVGPSEFFEVEGQAPPRTFGVGQGPCPGDSGGPAISDETGELVGVFSFFLGGDCSSSLVRAIYTQAAAFQPFVLEAFERAGHLDLVVPPEEDPVDPPKDPPAEGGAGSVPPAGGEAGSDPGEGDDGGQMARGGCAFSLSALSRSGVPPGGLPVAAFGVLLLALLVRRQRRPIPLAVRPLVQTGRRPMNRRRRP